MTHRDHVCPKCHQVYSDDAFINDAGRPTKLCLFCRIAYRDRLTSLHQRDATKPKREEAISVGAITKQEGYANHPLANLLALSHIAGAKRALAIRDGNSWRGKKAWRAYYEAKRALETQVEPTLRRIQDDHTRSIEARWDALRTNNFRGLQDLDARFGAIMATLRAEIDAERAKRDPNSSGVS